MEYLLLIYSEAAALADNMPKGQRDAFYADFRAVNAEIEATGAMRTARGLDTVEKEGRPLLLDVRLPVGLPAGGRAAKQFTLAAQ